MGKKQEGDKVFGDVRTTCLLRQETPGLLILSKAAVKLHWSLWGKRERESGDIYVSV